MSEPRGRGESVTPVMIMKVAFAMFMLMLFQYRGFQQGKEAGIAEQAKLLKDLEKSDSDLIAALREELVQTNARVAITAERAASATERAARAERPVSFVSKGPGPLTKILTNNPALLSGRFYEVAKVASDPMAIKAYVDVFMQEANYDYVVRGSQFTETFGPIADMVLRFAVDTGQVEVVKAMREAVRSNKDAVLQQGRYDKKFDYVINALNDAVVEAERIRALQEGTARFEAKGKATADAAAAKAAARERALSSARERDAAARARGSFRDMPVRDPKTTQVGEYRPDDGKRKSGGPSSKRG